MRSSASLEQVGFWQPSYWSWGAVVAGFLLGGKSMDIKKVLALGTGQRNLSAAFAVATSNFADSPDVLIEILVVSLIGLVILMLIARELGRRSVDEVGAIKEQKA